MKKENFQEMTMVLQRAVMGNKQNKSILSGFMIFLMDCLIDWNGTVLPVHHHYGWYSGQPCV
jgi:hypothetical protein